MQMKEVLVINVWTSRYSCLQLNARSYYIIGLDVLLLKNKTQIHSWVNDMFYLVGLGLRLVGGLFFLLKCI